MELSYIALLLLALGIAIGVLVVLVTVIGGGDRAGRNIISQTAASESLRAMVRAQRESKRPGSEEGPAHKAGQLAVAAAAESDLAQRKTASSGRMTMEKKLRYARLPLSAAHFYLIRSLSCVLLSLFLYLQGPKPMAIQLAFLGVVLPHVGITALVNYLMNRRVNFFDADYPVLLMSYVSLLKTGMNNISGLEAAAKGLDQGTLVRAEVQLLIERLRLGLTEEQALNSFGEDIAHPELELFVQSLLLSRKVGGTLSTTLERLAKQVRKRQQFRKQAIAAVGMERGSIVAVAFVMSGLLLFLALKSPELVGGAFSDDLGLKVVGWAIVLITVGFLWSRSVTNIKI